MKINIINQYDENTEYNNLIKDVLNTAFKYENLTSFDIINIILVNNNEIKKINSTYRMKEYPTDVISFPNSENNELGDIFISIDKVKEQANLYGHSFERELGFLVSHGFLHVVGYDHLTQEDEKQMFTKQEEILKILNLER